MLERTMNALSRGIDPGPIISAAHLIFVPLSLARSPDSLRHGWKPVYPKDYSAGSRYSRVGTH